jgi:hypothetical protein
MTAEFLGARQKLGRRQHCRRKKRDRFIIGMPNGPPAGVRSIPVARNGFGKTSVNAFEFVL